MTINERCNHTPVLIKRKSPPVFDAVTGKFSDGKEYLEKVTVALNSPDLPVGEVLFRICMSCLCVYAERQPC